MASFLCVGCGSVTSYAIDFANPQLVKEANRVEYTGDAEGHFYDSNPKDIATFIDVLKHMKVQKIKPDPLVTGGSSIGLYKDDIQIIGLGFAQHMWINDNNYNYSMDSETNIEFHDLVQRLMNSSRKP